MGESSTPTMSIRCVLPFRIAARERGLGSDAVWENLGFSARELKDPETRLPVAPVQQLARYMVEAHQLWDFGIHAARVAEAGVFDLAEYAARCQPTVEGSLRCVARLVRLLIDAGTFEWDENLEGVSVQWVNTAGAELDPVSVEFIFAYVLLAGRRHTGDDAFTPLRVLFSHPAPPDTRAHDDHFRCPVVFSAPVNALVFSHDQLEKPLRQADSQLSLLLDQAADHLLSHLKGPSARFQDDVRALIARHVSNDGAPVTAIADELGITPRTLHRRLAAEQTTYRDLADDVRKRMALAHVERGDLAMSEVAFLLGFSGVQAFHRAFKRWTGQTPGAHRGARGVSGPR